MDFVQRVQPGLGCRVFTVMETLGEERRAGVACARLAPVGRVRRNWAVTNHVTRPWARERDVIRHSEGSGIAVHAAALPIPPAPWMMAAGRPAGSRRLEAVNTAGSAHGDAPEGVDLDALYQSSYHDMVRLARQLVDDVESAQDVVHDAFLGLHRNRDGLESPANAKAYLRTSVLNHSRSMLRRRRTAREYAAAVEPEAGPGSDEPVLLADEHATVLKHLDTLPTRMREVLVLRYWEGLSEAEIATTLSISQGTVKSQASRALSKLSDAMKGGE